MLQHIINLLCMTLTIVFVIDLSGAVDTLKQLISRMLTNNKISSTNFNLKPFDCSLCTTWWMGLIYLLVTGTFTYPMVAFVALLAFLADVFTNILLLLKDGIITLIKICQSKL